MGRYNRISRTRKLERLTSTMTIEVPSTTLQKQATEIKQEKKTKGISLTIGAKPEQKIPAGTVVKMAVDPATPGADKTITVVKQGNKTITTVESEGPRYMAWSVEGLWNMSIGRPDRPIEPRSHLYASELGKAPVDLFLALKGTIPSNPPNDRSSRKFEAGDIWEWILELVLRRAGLLISNQVHISRCYPGLLEVTGRLDKIAGGKPDWEKAKQTIETDFLPDFIKSKAETIINDLSKKFPQGLKEIVIEIKSCSSFMFETYDRSNRASDNHELQAWHYLKNYDEAHVFYVCRDDVRVKEIAIYKDDARIEAMYRGHIETITKYWKADQQPPLEKEIVFDDTFFKFKDNWRIKYSNYLTMLYGYKNQKEYEDQFRPMAARFNRVVGRIATNKPMTKNNLDAIKEMKVYYPEFEKHIPEIKKHKDLVLAEPEVIENGTE